MMMIIIIIIIIFIIIIIIVCRSIYRFMFPGLNSVLCT